MHRARWFRPGRCQVSDAFTEFGISGKEGSRLVHLSPVSPASKNTSVHIRPRSIIVHRAQTSLCARRITFFLSSFPFFIKRNTANISHLSPLFREKNSRKTTIQTGANFLANLNVSQTYLRYLFVELSFSSNGADRNKKRKRERERGREKFRKTSGKSISRQLRLDCLYPRG